MLGAALERLSMCRQRRDATEGPHEDSTATWTEFLAQAHRARKDKTSGRSVHSRQREKEKPPRSAGGSPVGSGKAARQRHHPGGSRSRPGDTILIGNYSGGRSEVDGKDHNHLERGRPSLAILGTISEPSCLPKAILFDTKARTAHNRRPGLNILAQRGEGHATGPRGNATS